MNNKKSNFLIDNIGYIILSLLALIIIILFFPGIAEGFEKGLEFLRDLP